MAESSDNSSAEQSEVDRKRSRVSRQIDLLYILKQQLDILYEQNKIQRAGLKSVAHFRKFMATKYRKRKKSVAKIGDDSKISGNPCDGDNEEEEEEDHEIQNQFQKFDSNYRYWSKWYRKLNRKKFPNRQTLYDTMYDLYEDLILSDVDEVDVSQLCDEPNNADNLDRSMLEDSGHKLDNEEKEDEKCPKMETIGRKVEEEEEDLPTPTLSLETLLDNYKNNVRTVSTRYSARKKQLFREEEGDQSGSENETYSSKRIKLSSSSEFSSNRRTKRPANCQNRKLKSQNSSRKQSFICQDCGLSCKDRYALTSHRYIHLGIKFICSIGDCTMVYTNKQNFRRHCRIRHRMTCNYPYKMIKVA